MGKVFIITTLAILLAASPVSAIPNLSSAQLITPGTERILTLPPAAGNSPVIYLGTAIDPQSGKMVEGYAIVKYTANYAKPPWAGSGKNSKGEPKCYSFIAKGAKWKTTEPWVVNPSNNEELSSDFIKDNLVLNIDKWETAAKTDILGGGSLTLTSLLADTNSPDGQNEVYFADVSSSGAVAVTIVWGIFGGPPAGRELVEWDQVYDDVDYDWSASGEPNKMDFENIATHELGHSVGMGHPDDLCTDETMYRLAALGEIKKRDLHTGDIAGIDELY